MSFLDTIRLALSNLRQAKLRTALTVLGVAIGIASLSVMLSFGVAFEDQLVGRLTKSGVFDSITVAPGFGRMGGAARGRRGGPARGDAPARGTAPARGEGDPPPPSPTTLEGVAEAAAAAARLRLDDEAIQKISAIPNVKSVHPNLRVPLQLAYKDVTEFTSAAGVPLEAGTEGAFQSLAHGKFFANETDDACMLSLDMAKRLTDGDPKDLIGQKVTLTYAAAPELAPTGTAAPTPPAGVPGLPSLNVRRVEVPCPIVGIAETESAPGLGGGGSVSSLMIPLAKARAIDAVQVTSAQSLLRRNTEPRGYGSLTVKVKAAAATREVEDAIKKLGYSAFSLNDLLQGAKRVFLILDIVLGLIGSIALAVSSLGIVNTMVMSILERTREIGIMKAIGGSDRDIRKIFLIEASAIGLMGGITGLILGWLIGRIINFGVNVYIRSQGGTAGDLFSLPFWLIGGAIAFSIFVSLIAGSYPARRAARLDPIQALRHD